MVTQINNVIAQQQFLRNSCVTIRCTQKGLAQRMDVPWSTFEKWLAPTESKSFREMPQMAWSFVKLIIEHQALVNELHTH